MQSAEELAIDIEQALESYFYMADYGSSVPEWFESTVEKAIRARDAEWQARVDTLLEDNARSEEQVKKQFATAVSFKARAEKAEARGDKLEAALEEVVATYPAEDAMRAAATEALRKAGEI